MQVHRLVYEHMVGAIPSDYVIDHVCHSKATCADVARCPHRVCLRPEHLRAVTRAVNSSAERTVHVRTHCVNMHEFTATNTTVRRNGARVCRTCSNARAREVARRPSPDPVELRMCKSGLHVMTSENTWSDSRGYRRCLACRQATLARYAARRVERLAAEFVKCGRGLHALVGDNVVLTGRGRECRSCREVARLRCANDLHDMFADNVRFKTVRGRTYRVCRACDKEGSRRLHSASGLRQAPHQAATPDNESQGR